MNKVTKLSAAALALCLAGTAMPAAAGQSIETRAISAISVAIASQGNAALLEIRRELKETMLEQLKPFLPAPTPTPAHG